MVEVEEQTKRFGGRVAIVGSGPSGFYTAEGFFKHAELDYEVHMFDRLPTPYGLVRGGVAPDHQQIKSVVKIYERIAQKPNFHFWGNVHFGQDITRAELLEKMDYVVYATGSEVDRPLKVPGVEQQGSHSATAFVGWYNGHPDYVNLEFDFSSENVVIIGMGNVALDVARILAKTEAELANTDIAGYALEALRSSKIRRIDLIGRRGPVQAAFTPVELREFLHLQSASVSVDPEDFVMDPLSQALFDEPHHRNLHQNMDLLQQIREQAPTSKSRQVHFQFHRSPVEILGDGSRVNGVRLVKNKLVAGEGNRISAQATEDFEEIEAGLVFRSIGYYGTPLQDVPFDDSKGIIPNQEGQVIHHQTQEPCPNEYVVGWAKRGASGVIGSNKHDAHETLHRLFDTPKPSIPEAPPSESIAEWLTQKQINFVTFDDWKRLDQEEVSRGENLGKVRDKFTSVEEMMEYLKL